MSPQQDTRNWTLFFLDNLPINGLSDVIGIISDTVFRKIVKDSRIVTPETFNQHFRIILRKCQESISGKLTLLLETVIA